CPGGQFFSRTAFARNKNSRLSGSDALDHGENGRYRGALSEDTLAFLCSFYLREQFPLLQRVSEGDEKFVAVERLWKKIICAKLCRLDGGLDRRMSGDHDHRSFRSALSYLLEDFDTVHVGHLNVQQYSGRNRGGKN